MKTLLISVSMALVFTTFTQAKDPMKWGKINPDDLKMTVYANDPTAPAVILSTYGEGNVGPRTEYVRHIRIKILKPEGLKYAAVEIPFRPANRYDHFNQFRAQTFNLSDDGKITVTKLKAGNYQDVYVNPTKSIRTFTFPDVKVGSVIEYEYTLLSYDLIKLDDWYFQSAIPTAYSEYEVSIPRRFDYLVTFQKGRPLDYDEQQQFADRLQWLYSTKTKRAHRELISDKYILYNSPKGTIKVYLTFGETMRFKMTDMPAAKIRKGDPAMNDYVPMVRVHLYLAAGNFPFYYHNILLTTRDDYDTWNRNDWRMERVTGYIAYWLPTWQEATKKWLDNEYLGKRLIKGFGYQPVLDGIVTGGNDDFDKIKKIYGFVHDSIRWNGSFSMYAHTDLDKVLKNRVGNSGEKNLLLIALLRRAGFNTDPVLVRTRNLGRVENMYPVKDQFNNIIACVQSTGGVIYLDATSDESTPNILPGYDAGTTGWLLKKDDYKWVDLGSPEKVIRQNVKMQDI